MNYYTLFPNYYQGFNSARQLPMPQQEQNIPPVLKILAQALKLSIAQFSAYYNPNIPENEHSVTNQGKKVELPREQLIQKFKSEEKNLKTSHPKNKQIQNIEQNVVILQVCGQKHNQNSSHTNTNDQVLSQNLLGELHKEKDDLSAPKRKQNIRPKKHSFHVVVPAVNLIEAIEPSAFYFDNEQLRKRKESLMLRQVSAWNEKVKNRRDKREIRMLNK